MAAVVVALKNVGGLKSKTFDLKQISLMTSIRSSAGRLSVFPARESVAPLDAAPLLPTTVVLSPPAPSTPTGFRLYEKMMKGSSDTSEVQLKRIVYLLFERVQLTFFLRYAIQHLSEAVRKLHAIKVVKRALVATVDLQTLEMRTPKAEK